MTERYVPGEGPANARIAIVGEAPGAQEESLGRPFVGTSGSLLNQMLESVGIERSECYITNVMKIRPKHNDFGVFYQDSGRRNPMPELSKAREDLIEELKRINPNVVVALGNEAMDALTGTRGIMNWRGSIMPGYKNLKVIPTYHPAAIMRQYSWRTVAEFDLKRVKEHQFDRTIPKQTTDFLLDPEFDEVMQTLDEIERKQLTITFDIETIGCHVRCLGLGLSHERAICIPFILLQHRNAPSENLITFDLVEGPSQYCNSRWTVEEEYAILERLNEIFLSGSIPKIAQNYPFDSTILAQDFGFEIKGLVVDTMIAQHTCYPELPKSLDFMCSIYTTHPRYSDYDSKTDRDTWRYNCMDCVVTYQVYLRLKRELKALEVDEFYYNHCLPTMYGLTRAQNYGVKVNVELREKLKETIKAELDQLKQRIPLEVGYPMNPNSPKQVKEVLYSYLRLPPQRDQKGKVTTGEKALLKLKDKTFDNRSQAAIEIVLRYKKLQKILGGFLESKLDDRGYIHTSYNSTGTVNGRIASSKTIFGDGGNLQQIPKGPFRRLFTCEDDELMIKSDLSQAEARLVAWDASIDKLIQRFLDPEFDIHTWNAAENIFKVSPEVVTKEMRNVSKAGVHGGNYGLGPRKAAEIFGLEFNAAKLAIEAYRRAVPEIKRWWASIEAEISATRSLTSILGRKRIFLERLEHSTFRSGYSFKPQSVIGDIINRAFAHADEVLRPIGWRPALQVHDEIVFVGKAETIREAIPRIKNLMEYPILYPEKPPLVIPADVEIGRTWYDLVDEAEFLEKGIPEVPAEIRV